MKSLLVGVTVIFVTVPALAQVRGGNAVPCWYVPNGANQTINCANGYWQTHTPDGEVFTGNGSTDPHASVMGSSIVINPATGGIDITKGQTVTPPTQTYPVLEPGQANAYGLPHRTE